MLTLHCKTSGLVLSSMIEFNEHKSIAITAHLETAIKQLVTKRSEMLTTEKSNLCFVISLLALILIPIFKREINHKNPQ